VIAVHDGDVYCNTGDWVENCSALLEFDDGELRLVSFCPETGTIAVQDSSAAIAASLRTAARSEASPPKVETPA
jgi:hypothetical protein